eukprot:Tbor_TRINITY_DN6168_c1_g1::TRINITY_DN6168_c1_g1_i2::g.22685::m.22685
MELRTRAAVGEAWAGTRAHSEKVTSATCERQLLRRLTVKYFDTKDVPLFQQNPCSETLADAKEGAKELKFTGHSSRESAENQNPQQTPKIQSNGGTVLEGSQDKGNGGASDANGNTAAVTLTPTDSCTDTTPAAKGQCEDID